MQRQLVQTAPVSLNAVVGEGHLVQAFDVSVVGNGFAHVRRVHMAMRRLTLAEIAEACSMHVEASLDAMGQLLLVGSTGERELVEVSSHHGAGHVRVAADTPEVADALVERLTDALREQSQKPADPRVPIYFWTLAEHGPEPMRRKLHAPRWSEISGNYAEPVRSSLERIMSSPPEAAGGIALWRGVPGTGKTTALRALAREWRDAVDVHVIVDPEVFLGDRASYLVNVLFGNDVDEHWDEAGEEHYTQGGMMLPMPGMHHPGMAMSHGGSFTVHVNGEDARPRRPRAKLIVLEDAGELISADARVSAGQALSRLLNLTDGMLGQGTNVSVLVTTNEPIDRLHDAIARPGRGWSHLEFVELDTTAANTWLAQHDSTERLDEPATLAELYGVLRGDGLVTLDTLET
ncbi:MAG: Cell division control-like protein [Thermoleophilia bacterium]|nr:Cell division control-like protein [Thermoleophilia bacterium]